MSNISQWDTSAGGNNASPPNGAPEGMARDKVNDVQRENMAAVARWYGDMQGSLATGGTSNAYTLTSNSNHQALADQSAFIVRFDRANTGAATFNVDGLGAKNLVKNDGAALVSGDIVADDIGLVAYNPENDTYQVFLSPRPLTAAAISGTNAVPVAGGYRGLVVEVTGDNAIDVDIDAITLENADGVVRRVTNVDLTLSFADLDTGSEASNTWYAVHVVSDVSTEALSGKLSLSRTSPMLDNAGDYFAFVGWVRNDGASNLFRTLQKGNRTQYVVGENPSTAIELASGSAGSPTTPTWTSIAVVSFVPPTAREIFLGASTEGGGGNTQRIIVAPNNGYGGALSLTNAPPLVVSSTGSSSERLANAASFMLEGANVFYAASSSNARVWLYGWTED